MIRIATILAFAGALAVVTRAQTAVDWQVQQPEILKHFQALVRLDTSNPRATNGRPSSV